MRTTRRILLTGTFAVGLLVGPLAGSALAHVEVSPDEATQGGSATLTFEVPTEKDVPTVGVTIAIPSETPIASVTAPATDGWTSALTTSVPSQTVASADGSPVADVVSRVTWTATGGGIPPEQSAEFALDVSGLPRTDTLTFKVLQTYADGSVVSWIEDQPPGAAEPEYPAPVLTLAPAPEGATSAAPSSAGSSAPASSADTVAASSTTSASTTTTTTAGPTLSALASAGATVAAESSAGPVVTAAAPSSAAGSPLPMIVIIAVVVVVVAGGAWWWVRRRRTS